MNEKKLIIGAIAIITLGSVSIVSNINGIDGALTTTIIGSITGIVGYFLGRKI